MELVKHSSVRKIPKGFEKEALTSKLWVLSDNAIKKHLMTERKGLELSLAANTLLTQLTEFKYRALLKHGPPSWRGAQIHWLLEGGKSQWERSQEAILNSKEGIQMRGSHFHPENL